MAKNNMIRDIFPVSWTLLTRGKKSAEAFRVIPDVGGHVSSSGAASRVELRYERKTRSRAHRNHVRAIDILRVRRQNQAIATDGDRRPPRAGLCAHYLVACALQRIVSRSRRKSRSRVTRIARFAPLRVSTRSAVPRIL